MSQRSKKKHQPKESKNMSVKRNFTFPMSTLVYDGDLILTAAEGQPAFAQKRLATDLLTRSRQLHQQLGGKGSSSEADSSATGTLTQQQNDAILLTLDLFGKAKDRAKGTFKGDDVKLSGEFQVGINEPRDLASILGRVGKVVDACRKPQNAQALQEKKGWISSDTEELAAAAKTVGEIDKAQLASIIIQIAGTDARNTAANALYANLLTIQDAADTEWPDRIEANRAIRASFRIGIFPPSRKGATPAAKTQSAGGATAAPSTPPPAH
jgi:hypothetical protein